MSKWSLVKLKNKIHVKHGFAFKSEFFSNEGDTIVLTPGNFYEKGGFKREIGKEKFYIGEIPKDYVLKKNDLIVAMTEQAAGLLGSCAIIPESDIYLHNQRLGLIVTNEKYLLKGYVYYLFQTKFIREQIRLTSSGTKVKHTSPERLYDLSAPLPDIENQRTIYNLLNILDEKIHINNKINKELEGMAQYLYEYWFMQFNFPNQINQPYKESGGKLIYNSLLKREIPEGWSDQILSDVANITMGQSPEGSSYNENGVGTIFYQGSTDFGWIFPKIRQHTTEPARMAKKGDILLSVRAPVGDMNVASTDCCIGRGLAALNSKDGFDGFLFYVMKYFKQVFDRRNSEGTTFGSITKNDLYSLKLAYPPKELLEKYDSIVSKYNEMIFIRNMENQKLEELRDWLLPMLMNGQISIRDAESSIEEVIT